MFRDKNRVKMNGKVKIILILALAMVFLIMAAGIAGLVLYFYLSSTPKQEISQPLNTTTTTIQARIPKTTIIVLETTTTTIKKTPEPTTSTIEPTLTTIKLLHEFNVSLSSSQPYDGEIVMVNVTSVGDGRVVSAASIYLDGRFLGMSNGEGKFSLTELSSGYHQITLEKDGFENKTISISVGGELSSTPGAPPLEPLGVTHLTEEQRADVVDKGLADFRFYYSPSCPVCNSMIPYVSDIVELKKNCVIYEKLNLYRYSGELNGGEYNQADLPIIIISGKDNTYKTTGYQSYERIVEMLEESAPKCR